MATDETLFRNPQNIFGLEDAMVFISTADAPKIGKNGHFGKEWATAGVLADGMNLNLQRTLEENTVSGAGFGVVSRTYKAGDASFSFETLETNAVTRWIAWPDRSTKNDVTVLRHTNRVARAYVAWVEVGNNGLVHISVSRYKANLRMENVGRNESVEGKEVTVGLIPGPQKDIIEERWFRVEEGEMIEVDPKIFVEDSAITGTAGETKAVAAPGEASEADLGEFPKA